MSPARMSAAPVRAGRLASALLALGTTLAAANYHVSPDGDDAHAGTLAAPLATIQRAATLAVAGDTVHIHAGIYRETVVPANSGTEIAPIVFQAYDDGGGAAAVMVSALDVLTPGEGGAGQWQAHAGSIHKIQLDATFGNSFVVGGMAMPGRDQVFVDGEMMAEARWPNAPDAIAFNYRDAAVADGGSLDPGSKGAQSPYSGTNFYTGTYVDAALPKGAWAGAHIDLQPGHGWWPKTGVVTGFSNAAKRLTFRYRYADTWNPEYDAPAAGDPYYLWGRLAALDRPGEAFFDVQGLDGPPFTLYLWVPEGDSPSNHVVEMRRRDVGFQLADRAHIAIRGLRFRAARIATNGNSVGLDLDRLAVDYAAYNLNLLVGGSQPPAVDLQGQGHRLANSLVAETMNKAINAAGTDIEVVNCVTHSSKSHGISTDGAERITVADNTVVKTGSISIAISGKQSRFLRNHCYLAGLHSTDLAMMNTWNSGHAGGTEVAYNLVHDNRARRDAAKKWWGGQGIRLDSGEAPIGCSGFVIHHNVVWNTTSDSSITAWGLSAAQREALGCGDDSAIHIYANTVDNSLVLGGSGTADGHRLHNNIATHLNTSGIAGAEIADNLFIANEIVANLSGDPGWLNAAHRNYRLAAGSQAIDAGRELPPYTDSHAGLAPDLGAYETGPAPWQAGAFILPEDLADLRTEEATRLDGSSVFRVVGLPFGRRLPDAFALRIGDRTSTGFHMEYDFSDDTMAAAGVFTVDVSGLSGHQSVAYTYDGVDFVPDPAGLDLAAFASADDLTPRWGTGGTVCTWLGSRLFGHPAFLYRIELAGLRPDELSEMPVPVVIDTAALVAAGRLRPDGADLRFYDDAMNLLDHHVESGMNSASTLVWLRRNDDGSGGNLFRLDDAEPVFYLSCGRPELSSQDNPAILAAAYPLLAEERLLWLRANDLAGHPEGDPVALWPDVSGRSSNAIQETAGYQPTFRGGVWRGLPAIRFDGDDFLDLAAGLPDLQGSLVGDCQVFGVYINPAPGDTFYQRLFSAGETGGNDYSGAGFALYVDMLEDNKTAKPNAVPVRTNSGKADGSRESVRIAKPYHAPAANAGYQGDILELIAFPRSLDYWERTSVGRYLDSKFGLGTYGRGTCATDAAEFAPLQVLVDGRPATHIALAGNGSLTFTVPPYAGEEPLPVAVDVTVILPDGATHTLAQGFTYTDGPEYLLTVGQGSGSGRYPEGAIIDLAANPAKAGWVFNAWTGAAVADPGAPATTLVMPAAEATVAATYRHATGTAHTLTVGNGLGSGTYAEGTAITIVADAAPAGQVFNAWTGASVADPGAATTILAMPAADVAVTATFRTDGAAAYTLGVTAGTGSGTYAPGTELTIAADWPPTGQAFDQWTGDIAHLATPGAPVTGLVMPAANVAVAATFRAGCHVTFAAPWGGLVNGQTTLVQAVPIGGDCAPVTAAADPGFTFTGWIGDMVGPDNPLTVTNVTASMTIQASFTANEKLACGLVFAVSADEIDGLGPFTKAPKVWALFHDPGKDPLALGKPRKAAAKPLAKIAKGTAEPIINALWTKKIRLHDLKAWKLGQKTLFLDTPAWLAEHPVTDLNLRLHAAGKENGQPYAAEIRTVALACPALEQIRDEADLAEVSAAADLPPGGRIILSGRWFGSKPPKAWLEYLDANGAVRPLKLKAVKPLAHPDAKGKPQASVMHPESGDSVLTLQLPAVLPGDIRALAIDNGLGLAARPLAEAP